MIYELYILFGAATLIMVILSFAVPQFKSINALLAFLTCIFCLVMSITSADLDFTHCAENATDSTGCFTYTYVEPNLTLLWAGLGVIMLVFTIAGFAGQLDGIFSSKS